MKNFTVGTKVHVDTDNQDWGRVASDATVVIVYPDEVLVNVESIRANILVPFADVWTR